MPRILIADDDPIICEIVSTTLISAGHAVGVLGNGADMLAAIKRRPPDLVILDCNMPNMSGIMVLRAMRGDLKLHDVPVLMLTGRRSDEDEALARFDGADGYMRKPFTAETLLDRVQRLLDGYAGI